MERGSPGGRSGRIGGRLKPAFAAAASAALLAAAPASAAHPAKAPAAVRARLVSGGEQSARAYVATAATAYEAEFPHPIVVKVDGPPVAAGHPRHVVFTCMTPGCIFAPTEQHEFDDYTKHAADQNNKDIPNAYDARVHDGRAGAYLTVQARAPAGTYTIRILPVANRGERAFPTFFTLRAL